MIPVPSISQGISVPPVNQEKKTASILTLSLSVKMCQISLSGAESKGDDCRVSGMVPDTKGGHSHAFPFTVSHSPLDF